MGEHAVDQGEKLTTETAAEVGTACHMMLESSLKADGVLRVAHPYTVRVVTKDDGSAHARLSPSAASRWTTCPGSVVLVPKSVDSAARVVDVNITEMMMIWVHTALQWITGYLKNNPGSILYSEERARAGVPFGCPDDMWGTADVVIVNRRQLELVIVDAKFGYNEVQAEKNKQLLLYAIGLAHDFGWPFNTVRMVILQPRSEEPVKQWVIEQDKLREEMERLRPKVANALLQWTLQPAQLQLVASEEGCKWCEAAPVCPELQRHSRTLAIREFSEPQLISEGRFLELLEQTELAELAVGKLRAHALKLILAGVQLKGWKAVEKNKHRVWKDPLDAGEALVQIGLPREEVFKEELQFTPAQAEKRVGTKEKKLLEGFIEKPVGEPVLARETDRRPALAPDFTPC